MIALSFVVMWAVTAWVVTPGLERWIACRSAFPLLASALLVMHYGVGTAGFSLVWAAGLLLLCWQVGARKFRLMMTLSFGLCALAALEALAALYLQSQRCGL
jgi:hypothetical protein